VQGTFVGIDRKTTSMDTQIAAQFKRFQIIQEILNTEYLYVEDLKTLVKVQLLLSLSNSSLRHVSPLRCVRASSIT
jgi:hypothetical protein